MCIELEIIFLWYIIDNSWNACGFVSASCLMCVTEMGPQLMGPLANPAGKNKSGFARAPPGHWLFIFNFIVVERRISAGSPPASCTFISPALFRWKIPPGALQNNCTFRHAKKKVCFCSAFNKPPFLFNSPKHIEYRSPARDLSPQEGERSPGKQQILKWNLA